MRHPGLTNRLRFTPAVILVLVSTFGCDDDEVAAETQVNPNRIHVEAEGRVLDANGRPAPGVRVALFDYDERDWAWQRASSTTDAKGQYRMKGEGQGRWGVTAGGLRATLAGSKRRPVEDGGVLYLEDLTVRLASASLTGRVVDASGRPAANMEFGIHSDSFKSMELRYYSHRGYPRLGPGGEFRIPHVLPDEPILFFVASSERTAHVWTPLDPGASGLELRMNAANRVELAPEWAKYGDLRSRSANPTRVGEEGLSFELPDLDGRPVSLQDPFFEGKVVIVNIWGTWCGGCIIEIPHLIELREKYGDRGLEIVGVAFEEGDPAEYVQKLTRFISRKGITYPVLIGGEAKDRGNRGNVEAALSGLHNFRGFPTTIYLDRSGRVRDIQVGFVSETPERLEWQIRQIENRIERLLD